MKTAPSKSARVPRKLDESPSTKSMPSNSKLAGKAAAAAAPPTKRVFKGSFKKASAPTHAATGRADYATLEYIAARYQKGDKVNQLSGNIYARFKPRALARSHHRNRSPSLTVCAMFGHNAAAKAILATLLYSEAPRWNPDLKCYTFKVHTASQAKEINTALRALDGHEADLPENADLAVFDGKEPPMIRLIPQDLTHGPTSLSQQVIVLDGDTYPLRDTIKELGFQFTRNFNGEDGVNVWVAPEDTTDNDLVINTIQEKGWKMDVYERE